MTSSLILPNNKKSFLAWIVMYKKKMGFVQQLEKISSVVGPRGSSKALPKAKLAPKERSWALFGGLLPVRSTAAFWTPEKPLHLRSLLSKSMRCTKNGNICSQHWSTEGAQFFFLIMTYSTLHNHCFKGLANWTMKFCLIHHIHLTSHQLTTTSSSISIMFGRENASTTREREKMLSNSSSNPKAWIFTLQE